MFERGLIIDNQLLAGLMIVVCLMAFFMPSTLNKVQAATVGRLLPSTKVPETKSTFGPSRYSTFDQTATMGGLNDQVGLSNAGTVMKSHCGPGSADWGLSHDTYGTQSSLTKKSRSAKKRLVMGATGMSDASLQAHL
jgi:hypothetical protein